MGLIIFSLMKIKAIVKIFRHGARTSSSIGRLEDHLLSPYRMGLTCVGYSQFFKKGLDILNIKEKNFDDEFNNDFNSFLNKGKMNIILSNKSRVLESAQALADGILSYNSEDHQNFEYKEEKAFAENVYECEQYGIHALINKYYFDLFVRSEFK